MVLKTRALLVQQRTQSVNALRAHLAELGIIAAGGLPSVAALMTIVREGEDTRLPIAARFALMAVADQIDSLADRSRQGEDDVVVRSRQKLRLAFGEPLPRRRALTLRAVPVAAGVVGDAFVRTVLAALDMSAERGGPTGLDRRHHLQLGEAHVTGVSLAPRRPMDAKDVGDLQARPRHAALVRRAAFASSG